MAVPAYLEEGLIDAVLARGPVWRDPATGQRAVATARPGPTPSAVDRHRRQKEDTDGRDRA